MALYLFSWVFSFVFYFAYVYYFLPENEIQVGTTIAFIVTAAIPIINVIVCVLIVIALIGILFEKIIYYIQSHKEPIDGFFNKIWKFLDKILIKARK